MAEVQQLGITSIAIPALGCGNGGLDWLEVKPLIESAFIEGSWDNPQVTERENFKQVLISEIAFARF